LLIYLCAEGLSCKKKEVGMMGLLLLLLGWVAQKVQYQCPGSI
jgi:hypothetical protein